MTDLRKRNDELLAALEAAHTREAIAGRQLAELQQDFDALKAALAEALEVVRPWANINVRHLDDWELMQTTIHVGQVKACRAFLAKYGGTDAE